MVTGVRITSMTMSFLRLSFHIVGKLGDGSAAHASPETPEDLFCVEFFMIDSALALR